MTIWERLFGTPERAAKTLNSASLATYDYCDFMDTISRDKKVKCANCPYEYAPYGCEPKDMRWIDWLQQEVDE